MKGLLTKIFLAAATVFVIQQAANAMESKAPSGGAGGQDSTKGKTEQTDYPWSNDPDYKSQLELIEDERKVAIDEINFKAGQDSAQALFNKEKEERQIDERLANERAGTIERTGDDARYSDSWVTTGIKILTREVPGTINSETGAEEEKKMVKKRYDFETKKIGTQAAQTVKEKNRYYNGKVSDLNKTFSEKPEYKDQYKDWKENLQKQIRDNDNETLDPGSKDGATSSRPGPSK